MKKTLSLASLILLITCSTLFGASAYEFWPVLTNMVNFPITTNLNTSGQPLAARVTGLLGGITTTNDGYGGVFWFNPFSTTSTNVTNIFRNIPWDTQTGQTSTGRLERVHWPGPGGMLADGSVGGVLTGQLPNPGMAATTVIPGLFGSGTQVTQLQISQDGRITGATNVAITGAPPSGDVFGVDIAGSLPSLVTNIGLSGKRVYAATVTSGNVLIADGTQWNSTNVSGHIAITSGGVATLTNTITAGTASVVNFNSSGLITGTNALDISTMSTGILPVSKGGTGTNTFNAGVLQSSGTTTPLVTATGSQYGIAYWATATTLGSSAGASSTNQFVRAGLLGMPTLTAVNLGTADVTGTLLPVNGGTGKSSWTSNGVIYADSATSLTNGSALAWNGSNNLQVGSSSSITTATGPLTLQPASGGNINAVLGGAGLFGVGGSMDVTNSILVRGYGLGTFRNDAAIEIQNPTQALMSLFTTQNPGLTTGEGAIAFGAYTDAGVIKKTASVSSMWASATNGSSVGVLRLNAAGQTGGSDVNDIALRIFKENGIDAFGSSDFIGPGQSVMRVNGKLMLGSGTADQPLSLRGGSDLISFQDTGGTTLGYIGQAYAAGSVVTGSTIGDMILRTEGKNIHLGTASSAAPLLSLTALGTIGAGVTVPLSFAHLNSITNNLFLQGASTVDPIVSFAREPIADPTKRGASINYVYLTANATSEAGGMKFMTSEVVDSTLTERMRIAPGGSVSIGPVNPTPSATLHVVGSVRVGAGTDPGANNLAVVGNVTAATTTVSTSAQFSFATGDRAAVFAASGYLTNGLATVAEVNFLSGVTTNLQTALNVRVLTPIRAAGHPTTLGTVGAGDGQMFVDTLTWNRYWWNSGLAVWEP